MLFRSTASLTYSATTDSPDQYSINFDIAAELAGFSDILNSPLPGSPISITVPGGAPKGQYNGLLRVKNSSSGLSSSNYSIKITVYETPATPTVYGSIIVPENSDNFNYYINGVGEATAYNWNVPTGWTITSGTNTNSITEQQVL